MRDRADDEHAPRHQGRTPPPGRAGAAAGPARSRAGQFVAVADDAVDERLHDRGLERLGHELPLLFGVGDEAHFDEHCRHVRADEHAEGRLLDRARAHRHALAQARFDFFGERRRLLDVARLRHFPQDDLDIARTAAKNRQRLGLAFGHALRLVAVLFEAQVEDLRPGRRRADRCVGVEADEEVGLVVVGERRALVEIHRGIAVAGQDHAHAQPRFEAAFRRRATLSVMFFSSVPPGPCAPSSVPPWPASTTIVRMPTGGREIQERWRRRLAKRAAGGAGGRRCRGRLGDHVDDDPARTSVAGQIRGPERPEPRAEIEDDARAVAEADVLNRDPARTQPAGWRRALRPRI